MFEDEKEKACPRPLRSFGYVGSGGRPDGRRRNMISDYYPPVMVKISNVESWANVKGRGELC